MNQSSVSFKGKTKTSLCWSACAANLLQSVEGLASEDGLTKCQVTESIVIIYIPVLITAASLVCSPVDPKRISASDGKLEIAHFEQVSAVTFRKSLAAEQARPADALSLRLSKRMRERSVLVVGSKKVTEILSVFKIHWTWLKDEHGDRFPWHVP